MRVKRREGARKFGKSIENIQERFHFLKGLQTRTFASVLRLHLFELVGCNFDGGTSKQVAMVLEFGLRVISQLGYDARPLW